MLASRLEFFTRAPGRCRATTVSFSVAERDAMVGAGMGEGVVEGAHRLDELFAEA